MVMCFFVASIKTCYNRELRSVTMKKFITGLVISMMLVGCSQTSERIMVESRNQTYGLYSIGSKKMPTFRFSDYQKIKDGGYIVKAEKKYGYISESGKEILPIGKYAKIWAKEQMIIAKAPGGKITIFNASGKELYQENKKTGIIIDDLPIVHTDGKYRVLHENGSELVARKKSIDYVSIMDTTAVLVGDKREVSIVKQGNATKVPSLALAGTYRYEDNIDNNYLLYDKKTSKLAYIKDGENIVFNRKVDMDAAYFDKKQNIVLKKKDKIALLTNNGKDKQEINNYYQDNKNYIVRNDTFLYGPHLFYNNGHETKVEGVQLNPTVAFSAFPIFPVYVKDKGYQFYKFSGKPAFTTLYRKASPFDKNGLSIVSKEGKTWYLVDINNEKKTEEYKKIEFINDIYYAAYTTDSKYEIIDQNGKKQLDNSFMADKQITSFDGTLYGIFMKNSTSYVYDMNKKELLFRCEDSLKLDAQGYFVGNITYYNRKGEKVFTR